MERPFFMKSVCELLKWIYHSIVVAALLSLNSAYAQYRFPVMATDSLLCSPLQLSDVLYRITQLKALNKNDSISIKAGKLYLTVAPGVGYTLQSGLTAIVTANWSFYVSDPRYNNLSVITNDVEYSPVHKQVFIPVIMNLWLKENKVNILGDFRYYQFPSTTYGYGPETRQRVVDHISYDYLKAYFTVFRELTKDLYVGVGENFDKHWNVTALDSNTNFLEYNHHARGSVSSGLFYCTKYDSRRNCNNPQGGAYCSIGLRTNLRSMGSTSNWQSILIDARKYVKLPTRRSNILAFWSYNWLTLGHDIPYLDLPATAWDTYSNTGRGYTQGRLRGKNFIYLESEYRFDITCDGFLGGVVFANAQTVGNLTSKNVHKDLDEILPAVGSGLRFKLNKKSKVNFTVDYAVGVHGSGGFFFNVGEVF